MSAAMAFEISDSIPAVGAAPARSVLPTISEMIGVLDSLTLAGQRHMMDKVFTALRDHVTRVPRATSERNRRALTDQLGRLADETGGHWPDVRGFSQRAENLVALLSAIG